MSKEEIKPTVYPLHRTKIIYLIRHGQAHHNVVGIHDYSAYMREEFFDASLTSLGWQQALSLKNHLKEHSKLDAQLVVISPLMRTMQTAAGIFGEVKHLNGVNSPLLMRAKTGNSDIEDIFSFNSSPFIANELCREHNGRHPCDKRRKISEYREQFPAIDFSEIETDDDVLWQSDIRESKEELLKRCQLFLQWLVKRKEETIAVVSHSSFLLHFLSLFGEDCSSVVKDELHSRFNNCEIRSVLLVDRGSLDSNPEAINQYFTPNHFGGISCLKNK